MATRKPRTTKPAPTVETPARAAPRARRPGAARRAKPAVEPALAAAPEVQPAPEGPETSAEEQIRVRAYFLHLERRGRPADPTADWLRAEQEVAGDDASQ
jgi:uncharacterized protein involved in type VI secretion and phage assembly